MLEQDGIDFIVCGLKRFRPDVGKRINDLWTEYEENKTQEAQYVHGADKIECLGQASEYEETYEDEDFSEFQGLHGKIQFPEMIQWSVHLQQDREARIARKNRSAPVIFVRGRCSEPGHFDSKH
jgi:5'-deoxynucleotidase YfbR-like HD superfamily hydrolase